MWTLMPQSQHCGAQLHARQREAARSGAPAEAVAGRSAQDHEQAGVEAPGRAPASRVENDGKDVGTSGGKDDLTFDPAPRASWDEPARAKRPAPAAPKEGADDLPLPEGK